VTFTATVAAITSGAGTPPGSVVLVDTTTGLNLGTVTLANGSATVTTSSLAAGANTITAQYSGGSTVGGTYAVDFLPSSGSLTQTVSFTIVVLDPTASGALSLSGNASINIPGSVVVDSSSKTALTESGNAQITAAGIQVVGSAQKSGNATWSPAPITGAALVSDPLAGLAAPTGGPAQGSVNLGGNSVLAINPGIYTQINVSGNAKLTLNPGVYILAGGGLTVSGNASVSGSGVTLYNTESAFPSAGGTYGGITLSGNGTFNLTAPTSGPYAGVVLFQARTNTRAIALRGNAAEGLGGTVYAPAALLYLSGNASLAGPVVVNELSLTGNAASTQAADASDVSGGDAAGQLLADNVVVYVNDSSGQFTADELARIQAAVNAVDATVEPFGVSVTETTDPTAANAVIDTGSTSVVGGYADGILGCYTMGGDITLIQGWNWYAGADPAQIAANQYDFQTTVTHELGHALGLGEGSDPTSAMYGTLAPGTVIRTLTLADLNIPYDEGLADPQRAAVPPPLGAATSSIHEVAPGLLTNHAAAGGMVVGVDLPDMVTGGGGGRAGLMAGSRNDLSGNPSGGAAWVAARIEPWTAPTGLPALGGGWLRPDMPANDSDDILPAGASEDLLLDGADQSRTLRIVSVGSPRVADYPRGTRPVARGSKVNLGPAPAAVDAVFQARPLGNADLFRDGMVAPVGEESTRPDLAPAPGLGDNPCTGWAHGLTLADLAAAGAVVFGLLGAAWNEPAGGFHPKARIKLAVREAFGCSNG
jgi:Bacterial Ig-like domain (group 3)/Matrixin